MEPQDYTLFEDYLANELDAEVKAEFENRLAEDSDFKTEFETYKELSEHLQHEFSNAEARAEVTSTIEKLGDDYFAETNSDKTSKGFNRSYLAIAASIVIIIGFFGYNWFSVPTYSDYNNYGDINLTVRGTQTEALKNAETAFNEGDYAEANVYFNKILKANPDNVDVQFYKGIALIETEKYGEADRILSALANGNSVYKYEATWYRALSQLKQKDTDGAIAILETIPQEADVYEKAQQLLKKLQ